MNENIQEYIDKYPVEVQGLYFKLRTIVYDNISQEIEEKLWAKLPSYYIRDKFVRLIPFKDHINIEASAVVNHKKELNAYKITPKGMLQIYLNQDIPAEILAQIFIDTLCE